MKWINDGDTLVPIANWAITVEAGAIQQAKDLANLDFIIDHVSLMPDCHSGYGMPIGGVIACRNVVIPNAVGVDIGCVDKDTEYLTENGWIKIESYKDENILVFNKNENFCHFEKPEQYIVLPCDKFYHIKTNYGIDQMLSEEHKVLMVKGSHNRPKSRGNYYDILMRDLYIKNKQLAVGLKDKFISSIPFLKITTAIPLSDNALRIQIMVMADGYFPDDSKRCRCRFKKERKIKRAEELLFNDNIPYDKRTDNDGIVDFWFNAPLKEKRIGILWGASKKQLQIICDEVLRWDGTIIQRDSFFSKYKEDADFVQYVFAVNGRRATISPDTRVGKEGYRVIISDNNLVGFAGPRKDVNISFLQSPNMFKYCFTTSTGYWVMRRNGCIAITGNCGMGSVETNIPVSEIRSIITPENNLIRTILLTIKNEIPMGMRHHGKKQSSYLLENPSDDVMKISIIKDEIENAKFQIGTLGGGNHFIELQENEKGNLCLMLHSGSRNFGFKIAHYFNQLAQEIGGFKYTGEGGLAHLEADSKVGQEYITAMNFALDFAKENRKLMMEKFKSIVFELIQKHSSVPSIEIISEANIHHNYAALENHYGEAAWVHRKGAICMTEGVVGIIPGSMGTASFIVRGKGNKESFCSASHGSGRKMGRNQFNKQYSFEQAEKSMEGIEHLGWSKDRKGKPDFSEAPEAYKDIEEVIQAESDLVDVIMRLRPIGAIKA